MSASEYTLRGKSCVVGVAESRLGRAPGESVLSLQAKAARDALAEAGLTLADVDGLMVSGYPYAERQGVLVADYLGLKPKYIDSTNVGGSGFVVALERAAAAIAAGLCETVLITYGSMQATHKLRKLGGRPPEHAYAFEVPTGIPLPLGGYALAASRYMHEYGATSEQLAEVSVAARRWAALNPKAYRRDPITVEDVLESKMIATPLHVLDCCLVSDGGGAVVLTSSELASRHENPVYLLGSAYSQTHEVISQMPDLTVTAGAVSGPLAFSRAGLGPADMDLAQIYDSFTITVLLALEDLGFVGKGEAGSFAEGGRLAPGGELALNTSGGGLSYCHPGMFGIFLVIELVRQLRGQAGDRQVADAKVGVCHGVGGQLSTAATAVLGLEEAL